MTRSRSAARVLAAAVFVLASTSSGLALADDETGVLSSRHKTYESPQRFAIEVRLGPYYPRVDTNPTLAQSGPYAGPYQQTFGTSARVEVAGEFDYQAYRIPGVGTIGPGISVGYTSASGLAPLLKPEGGQKFSAETTSLSIFPMYLVAVVRFDILDRQFHVPLVPYLKGGLGYALWQASNSAGTSVSSTARGAQTNGVLGEGHTWGTQLAVGLAIDLNFLDRRASVGFDNATGVNHTYIFGELMRADLSGIFQSEAHTLYVGDYTWMSGVAFEF
jgi:hypothetical protein